MKRIHIIFVLLFSIIVSSCAFFPQKDNEIKRELTLTNYSSDYIYYSIFQNTPIYDMDFFLNDGGTSVTYLNTLLQSCNDLPLSEYGKTYEDSNGNQKSLYSITYWLIKNNSVGLTDNLIPGTYRIIVYTKEYDSDKYMYTRKKVYQDDLTFNITENSNYLIDISSDKKLSISYY